MHSGRCIIAIGGKTAERGNMRYRLDTDNDGHWFVYPDGMQNDFERWLKNEEAYGELDYDGPDFSQYGINNPYSLTFIDPKES